MEHKLRVTRRIIWNPNNDDMIALGVRADTIKVEFDSEWSDMDWIVVHFSNKFDYHRTILEGDTVTVPWELLLDSGMLYVTFVGYKGLKVRLTTEQMSRPYFINPSGPALLESPIGSSPDDMQYFLGIAKECADAEAIRAKAEEQRRINELVRLNNEDRRRRITDAMEDKLELLLKAASTLGSLHTEVPYLFIAGTLFDNNPDDEYIQSEATFSVEGTSSDDGVFDIDGEFVGCS